MTMTASAAPPTRAIGRVDELGSVVLDGGESDPPAREFTPFRERELVASIPRHHTPNSVRMISIRLKDVHGPPVNMTKREALVLASTRASLPAGRKESVGLGL